MARASRGWHDGQEGIRNHSARPLGKAESFGLLHEHGCGGHSQRALPTLAHTLGQKKDVEWQKFKEMYADRHDEITLEVSKVRK